MTERPVFERVGVTSTRYGLSVLQERGSARYLALWRSHHGAVEFHHGDCVGGDATTAGMAFRLGYRIVAHPPVEPRYRAHVRADASHPPAPYLVRDQRIVDTVSILLALPRSEDEELRSGTWATVRRAWAAGLPTIIITPRGEVRLSGFGRVDGTRKVQ